jgi:hypothetical protein
LQPLGRDAHGMIEQFGKGRPLQCEHSKLGQEFLLADAQIKCLPCQLGPVIPVWRFLNKRGFLFSGTGWLQPRIPFAPPEPVHEPIHEPT